MHKLLSLVYRHEVGETISRKLLIKRRSNYDLHKINSSEIQLLPLLLLFLTNISLRSYDKDSFMNN
jgi:hypothetical protein